MDGSNQASTTQHNTTQHNESKQDPIHCGATPRLSDNVSSDRVCWGLNGIHYNGSFYFGMAVLPPPDEMRAHLITDILVAGIQAVFVFIYIQSLAIVYNLTLPATCSQLSSRRLVAPVLLEIKKKIEKRQSEKTRRFVLLIHRSPRGLDSGQPVD